MTDGLPVWPQPPAAPAAGGAAPAWPGQLPPRPRRLRWWERLVFLAMVPAVAAGGFLPWALIDFGSSHCGTEGQSAGTLWQLRGCTALYLAAALAPLWVLSWRATHPAERLLWRVVAGGLTLFAAYLALTLQQPHWCF